jgi:uncharacterized repeat protein (TIGR03803 family)
MSYMFRKTVANTWSGLVFKNCARLEIFGQAPRLSLSVFFLCFSAACSAFAQTAAFSVVYSFTGGPDGGYPGPLIQDLEGNIYGTTEMGGVPGCKTLGCGVVFQLAPATGIETVLYSFDGTAGNPDGVIRDSKGNLYGAAGLIYRISPTGEETVLLSDSEGPVGTLVGDTAGNLYGLDPAGSSLPNGAVIKLDHSGTFTVLHAFAGARDDGAEPMGGLIRDSAGNLYGVTYIGGSKLSGTVFKLSPDGIETILHNFDQKDGGHPSSPLTMDAAGNLYGVAGATGSNGGVAFKLDTARSYSVLYTFPTFANGYGPVGKLWLDEVTGSLYGATLNGGSCSYPPGCGVVFKIDSSGAETTLYTFTGLTDGGAPSAGVIGRPTADGSELELFGSGSEFGINNAGIIFRLVVPR